MKHKRPAIRRWLLLAFAAALAVSTVIRWRQPPTGEMSPGQARISLPEYDAKGQPTGRTIQIAYRDIPADTPGAPVLALIHGSPMGSTAMDALIDQMRGEFRVIAPDLPGFGGSTIKVADYSVRTHALNLRDLLKALTVEEAHLIGYSQGGGVILQFANQAPEMTQSLTMLSAIGVQELELLGDYTLNHGLYGIQWGALWLTQNLTPHFGYMDTGLVNVAYVRNFLDTDQRPLRGILQEYAGPMLIIHGARDALVPLAAAQEHARLVPQSELAVQADEGHLIPFTAPDWVAARIAPFIHRVEAGQSRTRDQASPERAKAAAARPASGQAPAAEGSALAFYIVMLILGAQVSEDLTCIAGGILASQGVIAFAPAVFACLAGIVIGDLLLFFTGRWLGRPALKRAPLRWLMNERDVEIAERWFHRRGPALIVLTRFIPGSRLPTYFAAGALKAPIRKFIFFFVLAAAIWTPMLVGLSLVLGKAFLGFFEQFERWAPLAFFGFVFAMLLTTRLIAPLFTWEGRRLNYSRWRRWTRWEFWPLWVFNAPVLLYVLYLGARFRCASLFTIVNPAMPHGGFSEESKSAILSGLAGAGEAIGKWTLLDDSRNDRCKGLQEFLHAHNLEFPVVLKPDAGQRGEGVKIVRDLEAAADYLNRCKSPVIAQEFLPGREYGVFYVRYPGQSRGCVWGITDKRFTRVTGDGVHSLRHLILADNRAVCMAPFFFRQHADDLTRVPAAGEEVVLAELGTHCRGALFLDGSHLITPALERRVDTISQCYDGFFFGRYDVRAESDEALQRGEFRVIELNGVTSEATWIYDPRYSVFDGWRTLMRQWRMAFEIAAENHRRGMAPTAAWFVIRLILRSARRDAFEA